MDVSECNQNVRMYFSLDDCLVYMYKLNVYTTVKLKQHNT